MPLFEECDIFRDADKLADVATNNKLRKQLGLKPLREDPKDRKKNKS